MFELGEIGDRLKELRERKGTTQEELAALLKVPRSTVAKWETGRQDFKSETIVFLADYFGVSADYLLRGVSAENKQVHDATGLDDMALKGLAQYADEDSELLLNRLLMDKAFYQLLRELKQQMTRRVKAINLVEFPWSITDGQRAEEERITKDEMAALCEWRMKQAVERYFNNALGLGGK